MAERDRAAVYVHLRGIPTKPFVDGARLRGKGFVGLNQVQIVRAPAGEFQRLLRGRDRACAHDRRVDARGRPGDNPRQRLDATLLRAFGRHQDDRGGAVIDARGITGRDRTVFLERRTQSRERIQ